MHTICGIMEESIKMNDYHKEVTIIGLVSFLIAVLLCCETPAHRGVGKMFDDTNGSIEEKIVMIADSVLVKHRKDLSLLKREIVEKSAFYEVHYTLKEKLMLGGGGLVVISKPELKVVKFELYQ